MEDRSGIFAGRGPGEPDRQEARDGNQRARQHRKGRRSVSEARGLDSIETLLELSRHHLHGDHGVVDEEPQRENQRAERNAVKVDPRKQHDEERPGEDDRHAERDDRPGPPSEAHEAHRQDDGYRFGECAEELADRGPDHPRLVCDLLNVYAYGQLRLNARHRRFEVLAELEHVAFLVHLDAEPDDLLSVEPHLELGRVLVGPSHVCDIADAKRVAVYIKRERFDLGDRVELARHAQRDIARRRDNGARGHDAVLRLERRTDLHRVEPELRKPLVGELDVDLLVLCSDEIALLDVRNAKQLLPSFIHIVLQLGVAEAFAGEGVEDAVGIAELVVEKRADHTRRQRMLDVSYFLPHFVPEVRNLPRRNVLTRRDEDLRFSRPRVAPEIVEIGQLLDLFLEAVGHLLLDLFCGGAGVERLHYHYAKRKFGILALTEAQVREDAAQYQHHEHEPDEGLMPQRPFGEVEAIHRSCATRVVVGWSGGVGTSTASAWAGVPFPRLA